MEHVCGRFVTRCVEYSTYISLSLYLLLHVWHIPIMGICEYDHLISSMNTTFENTRTFSYYDNHVVYRRSLERCEKGCGPSASLTPCTFSCSEGWQGKRARVTFHGGGAAHTDFAGRVGWQWQPSVGIAKLEFQPRQRKPHGSSLGWPATMARIAVRHRHAAVLRQSVSVVHLHPRKPRLERLLQLQSQRGCRRQHHLQP